MARYNAAISITFNENDGGLGYSINPECAQDVCRHYKLFGKWRARYMFFRIFWIGLRRLEKWGSEK